MRANRFAALLGVALLAVAVVAVGVLFFPDAASAAPVGRHAAAWFDPHAVSFASVLAALRAERVDIVGKMKALLDVSEAENRDLSAEEIAQYDELKGSRAALDARIARLEDLEGTTAALATVIPGVGRRQGVLPPPPGPSAAREFESFGEFMNAVRFNPGDQRLNYVENVGAVDPETGELRGELRMDNGPSGGFMVPTQMRSTIMRVEPQDVLVRPRAQVIPAGSPPDAGITVPALDQTGAASSNMYGGVEVKWIGEGEEKPETDARLREITLTPHEVAGLVTVTDKLLRNWQAAGAFIENLMRGAVSAAEDYAFLRGSGVHQPLGALNAGATKWINRVTAGRVTYPDLLKMVAAFLMRGGTSPVWSMPQSALIDIATMTDPEGHYIWKPNAVDGFAGTLLGYPVRWNNRMPGLGVRGDILLADWSHYLIKDGSGPFVAASEHVKFTSNKTVIKIFWNVDGAPWLTAPFKEENGYEVSPFVALDVPA